MLGDLDTYDKLADHCITTDSELKRANVWMERQKKFTKEEEPGKTAPGKSTLTFPFDLTTAKATATPQYPNRRTFPLTTGSHGLTSMVTCYNCQKTGHMAKECTKPKRKLDLKDIEEEDSEGSGKEYA